MTIDLKKIGLYFSVAVVALMLVLTEGCYYDNAKDLYPVDTNYVTDTNLTTTYSWSTQVKAIVNNTCAVSSCHAEGNGSGRVPLFTYDQVKAGIESYSLQSRVETGNMPPGGGISTTDKAALIGWIEQGYPNN
jgi:hypothetical protein